MPNANFQGLRVLSLESRRAQEMAKLITNNGGIPVVAPSVCELPLESNTEALEFARRLQDGGFDAVIFMTGVGVRLLTRIVERLYPAAQFAALLGGLFIAARGPKPVAALRELGVGVRLTVPEPNTWHDLLAEFDRRREEFPLPGKRVAIQEYGVSNPELIMALEQRGAVVTSVPVYEWTLPEDTRALEQAVESLIRGEIGVVLLTSSIQLRHLLQVAKSMGRRDALLAAIARTVVASIGPICSEEIRHCGLHVDLEPSHPKMGFLVQEAAERSGELLGKKQQASG